MSERTRAFWCLGAIVFFVGFGLLLVAAMLGSEYTQYPSSDLGLIGRDWGIPIFMIGLALMGIGGTILLIAHRVEKHREMDVQRKKASTLGFGEQLIKLKGQLHSGAITQEEYEQKKKKLLEKSET